MTKIWQVCRLQKWHFSRGIVTFFCHFGAIFSKMCKHIKNYSENSRKMTKKCKNLQFCRLPKWHFLEALSFFCHFGAICSNICKTSEIIRKIAEKWQKRQYLEKNHFFATCKIVIFLSFFWGSCGGFFVIFLSFWRGFSKILKSIKFFEKWHKNDKKYGSASGKMQFLQPAKLSFFWSFFDAISVRKIGKGQRFEKNAIFATCKNYKKYK